MNIRGITISAFLAVCSVPGVSAQQNSPSETVRPMVLTEAIPLEGVKGRFDHFGTSGKLLFISALGNNTVEVIGISSRTLEHTVTGVPNPQGLVFVPEVNKLFVASSQGKLYIYDAAKFDLLTSIDFHGDVDNLRYDAATKRVYVGYGDDEAAAIGIVDATTNQRLDEEYKLGAHPESFQFSDDGKRIFVNLPENRSIASIDLATQSVNPVWSHPSAAANFAMAVDATIHRLFIPCRKPARMLVVNSDTGAMTAWANTVGDTDDVFADAARRLLYVIGGDGYVDVMYIRAGDALVTRARVPTAPGARTGLYVPEWTKLLVAAPRQGTGEARLLVFGVQQ